MYLEMEGGTALGTIIAPCFKLFFGQGLLIFKTKLKVKKIRGLFKISNKLQ